MSLHLQLASRPKKRETFEELNAKIDFITQFASKAYFNKALKKLARDQFENATAICDYIMAEQTEINIKQSTKEGKIKILIWLSKSFKESPTSSPATLLPDVFIRIEDKLSPIF
jgi:hypothetical protein